LRIEQLTFTRFIAAISIVVFHFGKYSYLFNNEYTSFIFRQANLGVSYFFILSGFVMIVAYGNRENVNFIEYIKNRLARIYPVYFLAIFLMLSFSFFKNINFSDLFFNLIMVQAWIPNKALTINSPGWSLSVEMFFYICFPFLINRIYNQLSLKINLLWIVIFWLISQIIFHLIVYEILQLSTYVTSDIYYNPLLHFNQFLIGNLLGLFFIKKFKSHKKNYLIHIVIILTALILLLRFPIGFVFHNGLLAIIFIPIIFFISLTNDRFTIFFSKKPFVFLGEISFGIYILQVPIWFIFSDNRMEKYFGLNKELDFTSSFLIRLFILVIISALSYLYFEKPIRNKIKGRVGKTLIN